jgi:hypothetical protein
VEGSNFFGVDFQRGGLVIGGDDEGEALLEVDAHFDEVGDADGGVASDGGDALSIPDAEAGDSVEDFQGGAVDIDGKEMAVAEGPGEFGVDIEIEIGLIASRDFIDAVSVEAHEPICLVEAVLADEGWGWRGEAGGGVGDGAEGRVVDAAELKISVKVASAFEEVGVVRLVGSDDHLGGLGRCEFGLFSAFLSFGFGDFGADVLHGFAGAGEAFFGG